MTSQQIIYVLIMAVCLVLSAYFSATETAFSSINRTRLKNLAEKGNIRAGRAMKVAEDYDRLLSTVLICNNLVNIILATVGTLFFVSLWGNGGAAWSTVIITMAVLVFGEITPKSIAKDCPERFAMFTAGSIRALVWLLTPLNFVFTQWKTLIAKLLNIESNSKMSQDELLLLVEEVEEEGGIDVDEGELIKNAIEFSDREAGDILTHRVDIEAVDISDDKNEMARAFRESGFSRLLVYDDNIDRCVGVIHQKDFFTVNGITEKSVKEIMTPAVFVLKTEKVPAILKALQKAKTHIAVVLDEYGGTCGIVTMEDIIEELVGEIWDEHEEIYEPFAAVDKDTYIVDGNVDFDDFAERFGLDENETDMISLSGWIMERLGHVPETGDRFNYRNMEVNVISMDNHRVVSVRIKLIPEAQ